MSQIIINADDFGRMADINRAIVKAHEQGLINSISLMTNMPSTEEALELIRQYKLQDCVGVHLNLSHGSPLTPAMRKLPLLCDATGHFHARNRRILFLSKEDRECIRRELEAQIQVYLKQGFHPTHLDSHHHYHYAWPICSILIELAQKYQIDRIRIFHNYRSEHFPGLKRLYGFLFNTRLRNLNLQSSELYTYLEDLLRKPYHGNACLEIMTHPALNEQGEVIDIFPLNLPVPELAKRERQSGLHYDATLRAFMFVTEPERETAPAPEQLFIVIPTFNRLAKTRACLKALQAQTVHGFQVVVIDDGSTDGTAAMIAEQFPEITLLHGNGSLWWSGSTNLGVQYALKQNAQHILTLNDDTIPCPDFIEKMLGWARHHSDALLGAAAKDIESGNWCFGGERVNWWIARYAPLLTHIPSFSRHGLYAVTHYPGRGLFIPAQVFWKIGLFNSIHFPQAVADYDFSHHALRAGFPIYCNFDAVLLSYAATSGGSALRASKSWQNYFRHLFTIKGSANLKYFVIYAFRNCPPFILPFFLVSGITRRVLGYLQDWVLDAFIPRRPDNIT